MAAKTGYLDQHIPLHSIYGAADCCLCRLERENRTLREDYAICTLENAKGSIRLDELKEQNKLLIEDGERLAKSIKWVSVDSSKAVQNYIDAQSALKQHKELIKKINNANAGI